MAADLYSTKACTKCKNVKPLSGFGKNAASPGGLHPWCKECRSNDRARYYRENKSEINRKSAEWQSANRDKVSAYQKKHLQSGKRKIWRDEYERRNRPKHRAQANALRAASPEKYRAAERRRHKDRKDDCLIIRRAAARARYMRNLEAARKKARVYYKSNPVLWKAGRDRYRARKTNAEGNYTAADIDRIRADQKGKCAYCRCRLGKTEHIDHIIALANGGTNWPKNLQLTCAPCNLSKRAKHPIDFARQSGLLM